MLKAEKFSLIFLICTTILGGTDTLETILGRCCNLGVKWAWDNKTCTSFPTPVPNVSPENQALCLTTVDACCLRNYRERMCIKGHETAKSGRICAEESGLGGTFHRDCCEGCKIGLIAGSMGLNCEFRTLKAALGAPWDSSLTRCCIAAGGQVSTKPPRQSISINSPPTENICLLYKGQLCSHICIPEGTGFRCDCHPGFTLLPDMKSCLKDTKTSGTSSTNNYIQDATTPILPAKCPVGFVFNSQENVCDDVNECEIDGGNACLKYPYSRCINTIGSYMCERIPRENEGSLRCPPGYRFTDEATCIDINECLEGAHVCDLSSYYCINIPGGFDCQVRRGFVRYNCPAGYKFNNRTLNCDDVDECFEKLDACNDNEICRNTAGAYDCDSRCEEGHRFDLRLRSCQDEDECSEGTHDCVIGTEYCVNVPGSYQCHQIQKQNDCPPGFEAVQNYTEVFCQDVDECVRNLHSCSPMETCVNEAGGFRCDKSNTVHSTATKEMDDDLNIIPDSSLRKSSSPSSLDRIYMTTPTPIRSNEPEAMPMKCKPGFRLVNNTRTRQLDCEDIDECQELSPCDDSQLCQNTHGSFYCHCRNGYYRDPITKTCQDVNECQTGQHTCTTSQRCDNSPGSYTCIRITGCGTGYTLNSETGKCEDDDECLFGNHNCNALGPEWQCKNTLGSFRCEKKQKKCPAGLVLAPNGECRPNCRPGFEFNSRGECLDINECRQVWSGKNICTSFQRCVNTEGSYMCISKVVCPDGYEPDSASGNRCTDVDECSTGRHNCKHNQKCTNIHGSFNCECPVGYMLSSNGECEDINECTRFGSSVCSVNAECYNTQGSFRCICKEGFTQGQNNQTCDDINECANSLRLCDQTCVNTWGSFRCTCSTGWTLGSDKRTCEDVDECSLNESQGGRLCIGSCINTPGSFKCSCPDGYVLGDEGRTCQDVDECQRSPSPCRADESCLNTRGGYRCNRLACPPGYQKEGGHLDKCKKKMSCSSSDTACLKEPLTISQNYLSFTSNIRIGTIGYIDMFTMKGPTWPGAILHFKLEVKNTRGPAGVTPVTRDYFLLRRPTSSQAVISITRSIAGPQDVELELLMEVYDRGIYAGSALAQIVLVVSAHEF